MGCVELVYAALPAWVVVADSDLRTKPVPGVAVGWGRRAASDPTSPDRAGRRRRLSGAALQAHGLGLASWSCLTGNWCSARRSERKQVT